MVGEIAARERLLAGFGAIAGGSLEFVETELRHRMHQGTRHEDSAGSARGCRCGDEGGRLQGGASLPDKQRRKGVLQLHCESEAL